MHILEAQRDMRDAYQWGASGVLTSGLVWCVAGFIALFYSPQNAVWAPFVGGALIFPISIVIDKLLGAPGKHDPKNPLGSLAMANTFWLIFCLPIAYVVSTVNVGWFFPAMLLIICGRYLTFAMLYGLKTYWILGLALAAAAYLLVVFKASPAIGAFTGSAIELVFAVALYVMASKNNSDQD